LSKFDKAFFYLYNSSMKTQNEIERILKKSKLKQVNGLNDLPETAELMEDFFDRFSTGNNEYIEIPIVKSLLNEIGHIPDIPIAACRHLYPIYICKYCEMKDAFRELEKHPKEKYFLQMFYLKYYLYNIVQAKLEGALEKFGDWADAVMFDDFPESPFLSSEAVKTDYIDNIRYILTRLDALHLHLKEALDEYDKGKCMNLYSLIGGLSFDIYSLNRNMRNGEIKE